MASRRDLNGIQFSETFKTPKGYKVNMLTPESVANLEGRKVQVHLHSPARDVKGHNVYSVIHRGHVVGQTSEIRLHDANMRVDHTAYMEHLNNVQNVKPGKKPGKTKNTMTEGVVAPTQRPLRGGRPLEPRPGSFKDAETKEPLFSYDVETRKVSGDPLSAVHFGPKGPRYRR
jgi:hypothetical protein